MLVLNQLQWNLIQATAFEFLDQMMVRAPVLEALRPMFVTVLHKMMRGRYFLFLFVIWFYLFLLLFLDYYYALYALITYCTFTRLQSFRILSHNCLIFFLPFPSLITHTRRKNIVFFFSILMTPTK
jgi:hypothetical protein